MQKHECFCCLLRLPSNIIIFSVNIILFLFCYLDGMHSVLELKMCRKKSDQETNQTLEEKKRKTEERKKKKEESKKRTKRRRRKFFKDVKQILKLAILLYLIPIVDTLVLLIFLFQQYSTDQLLIFVLSLTSLISASSVSIAATILYFGYFKDNERVTENKIIGIVFSLSIHLIIEVLLLKTELNIIVKAAASIVLLILSILFAIFIFKNYRIVNDYGNSLLKKNGMPEFLKPTAKRVAENGVDGIINGEKYELGDNDDEEEI